MPTRDRRGTVRLVAVAIVATLLTLIWGASIARAAVTVTEFSTGISSGSLPDYIASGPDGNVWFTENTGNRVDPEQVATLAEPFLRGTERTHSHHSGVGLGLAIVERIELGRKEVKAGERDQNGDETFHGAKQANVRPQWCRAGDVQMPTEAPSRHRLQAVC